MYLFQQLAKQAKNVDFRSQQDARQWFYDAARDLGKKIKQVDPETVLGSASPFTLFDKDELTGSSMVGKMYLFMYDPKYKLKLPFYDAFPLVFPIEFYRDGFLGINLHYLPPGARIALMNALYLLANNDKYNKTTRLNISYQLLKQSAIRFSGFENCIKRYLFSHVRSSFMYINPKDWDKALLLPLQNWKINPLAKIKPPY